jgi:predicted ATPase
MSDAPRHSCRLIVLTGGPGAGKTAVLEVLRRNFAGQVTVLPEAASILFKGGFPRGERPGERRCAQRAIFHVQRQLERLALEDGPHLVALCDRGTVDGLAYWPGDPEAFWRDMASDPEAEKARYHAVIHLRTPTDAVGYDHSNPMRRESAEEAATIDRAIHAAWEGHPRRFTVESTEDFMDKVVRVLALIAGEMPGRHHLHAKVPGVVREP